MNFCTGKTPMRSRVGFGLLSKSVRAHGATRDCPDQGAMSLISVISFVGLRMNRILEKGRVWP